MLDGFQSINLFSTNVPDMLVNILVAFICGMFIAWLYKITYKGPGYSVSFVNSIVLLSMITSVVIMVIGNNLARAFGLVGAMSIIRFRTAVKETQDIVYIFFGLAIGMAAGVGYHKIAFAGSLIIGAVVFAMSKSNATGIRKEEYLLQFSYSSKNGDDVPPYLDILKKYCTKYSLINIKSIAEGSQVEVSYYIKLKDINDSNILTKSLSSVSGVEYVNLYFDEEQF